MSLSFGIFSKKIIKIAENLRESEKIVVSLHAKKQISFIAKTMK